MGMEQIPHCNTHSSGSVHFCGGGDSSLSVLLLGTILLAREEDLLGDNEDRVVILSGDDDDIDGLDFLGDGSFFGGVVFTAISSSTSSPHELLALIL